MAAGTVSLFLTSSLVGAFIFVSADQKNITAESGQNVTLSCQAPNNIPIKAVEWNRADLDRKHVLLYPDETFEEENQHPSFVNRVDLQDRQMKDGDVSLILKNVTTADNGTYERRVAQTGKANLKTDPICIIHLSVVPPGPPGGDTEAGGKQDGDDVIYQLLKAVAFALLFAASFVVMHLRVAGL